MADSTDQFSRIAALIERAGKLSGKVRGMRIEAEDWNALVDILSSTLDVSRLRQEGQQVQLEQHFASRQHEHLGEVSATWLDADLQKSAGGGGGSALAARLSETEAAFALLRAELDRLRERIGVTDGRIDRAALDEVARAKTLRDFEKRFDGVAQLGIAVGSLKADVDTLRPDVADVLEFRKSLIGAGGERIDVAKLQQSVGTLQDVIENLNGVDGRPLRLKDIEIKLRELSELSGVGGGTLDGRLADLRAQLKSDFEAGTKAAATRLETQARESETRLHAEIGRGRDEAVAAALGNTTAASSALEARLSTRIDERLATETTTTRNAAIEAARAAADARFADVPAVSREIAEKSAGDAEKRVMATLKAQFQTDMAALLVQSEGRMGQRLGALETALPQTTARLEGIAADAATRAAAALEATLTGKITAGLAAARGVIEAKLASQVETAVKDGLSTLDTRVANAVVGRMPEFNAQIQTAAANAVRSASDAAVAEVARQIAAADIEGKIKRAAEASEARLQAQVAAQVAGLESRMTTLVRSTADGLRGDLQASIDTSLAQIKIDLNRTLDDRIRVTRSDLEGTVRNSVTVEVNRASERLNARLSRIEMGGGNLVRPGG
jgi:hypothetical protein